MDGPKSPKWVMSNDAEKLPNQNCGGCNACCEHLIIDSPQLAKRSGEMCDHCRTGFGCKIYQNRPQPCRDFHCGWRQLPLGPEWRPDRSEILVIQEPEDLARGIKAGTKFHFFGRLDRIFWRPFIEFVSALLAEDRMVYISVPGDFGHVARMQPLHATPELKDAIAGWNYAAVVGVVAALVQSCLDAPPEAIVFRHAEPVPDPGYAKLLSKTG